MDRIFFLLIVIVVLLAAVCGGMWCVGRAVDAWHWAEASTPEERPAKKAEKAAKPPVSQAALDYAAAKHCFPLVDESLLKAALKDKSGQDLVRSKLMTELGAVQESARKAEAESFCQKWQKEKEAAKK